MSKNTGILYRTRKNLNVSTLMLLYQTLIQPYFEYCNVYGVSTTRNISRICLQSKKKAVRTITFGKWNSHTAPIFAKFTILNMYSINKLQIDSFVYKSLNNLLPPQFCNFCTLNKNLHDHNTRSKNNIHQIYYRIEARGHSMRLYDPRVWNSIPLFIRNSKSYNIFKKRYKYHLYNCQ